MGRRWLPWPDIELPLSQSSRGGSTPACSNTLPKALLSIPTLFRQPPQEWSGRRCDPLHHRKRHERSLQSRNWTVVVLVCPSHRLPPWSYRHPLGGRAMINSSVRFRRSGMESMQCTVPLKSALSIASLDSCKLVFTLHRARIELGPEMLPFN